MDPNKETPNPSESETPPETTETKTQTAAPSEETPRSETEVELEEVDFSALTEFVEADGEAPAPPVEQVAEPAETPDEETPPEDPPEPVETKSDTSEEQPPETKAEPEKKEQPPEQQAEPPAKPEVRVPTEEELQGMYKDHREKTLPKFEEMMQLTEEEAAALDEQPSKVLPKLAARLMYDTMLSTYNAVLAAMPSPVNRLIQASNDAKTAETEFYNAWPELKGNDKAPVIGSAIQAFRAANPRADRKTVIQQAGVMAMLQLGLDPINRQKPNGGAPVKPPAPRATPPKPAGGRNTTQTAPPKPKDGEDDNIFATMAEAFQKEYR